MNVLVLMLLVLAASGDGTVEIVHLPASIETYASVPLDRLHDMSEVTRLTLRDASDVRRFAALIEKVRLAPMTDEARRSSRYDARWSFVIRSNHGAREEISCDAFGQGGAIDGAPTQFLGLERVLHQLVKRYPSLEPTAPLKRSSRAARERT